MMIREYRIPLPLTLDEYQVAQLFCVNEVSKLETGGGEGVEYIKIEEFTGFPLFEDRFSSGTYTYKIYHLASRIPRFIRLLFAKNTMDIHEEAWNAFPYCRTVITNPGYMKDNFSIVIESMHQNDRGDQENVHSLSPELLEKRKVVKIDIGNDPFNKSGYRQELDPSVFVSTKVKRGPLKDDWIQNTEPIMTCYKLVRVEFKWLGLQKRIENFIHDTEHKLFLKFHRQLFCWIDKWCDLSLTDMRVLDIRTKKDLQREMKESPLKEGSIYSQNAA